MGTGFVQPQKEEVEVRPYWSLHLPNGRNRGDGVRHVLEVQSGRKRVRSWITGNSNYTGRK